MLASLPMQVRRMSHGSQQDQFLLGSYSTSPWSNSGSAMLALKPKPQHNKLSIGLLKASNTTGGRSPHACGVLPLSACRPLVMRLSAVRTLSVCTFQASRALSVCALSASRTLCVCVCVHLSSSNVHTAVYTAMLCMRHTERVTGLQVALCQ